MATTGRPREIAGTLRRGADRLSMLRLRITRTLAESGTQPVGEVRSTWTGEVDPEIARVARGLRSAAEALERGAAEAERAGGRRMGGYRGAGYLGTGDSAADHIPDVVSFRGSASGASIGGFPLIPAPSAGQPAFLPHPSQTLGEPTPDYVDED